MTGEEPALPTVRLHGRAPQLSRVRAWWHQPPAHRTALLVATFEVPAELADRLTTVAREGGASLFMALTAVT
ncbi:hypothetical protein AB0K78_24105, partial [Streptomyces albidoflavus]|uniref:hypothetical protein n=1 Tax=Streptomyces albidoflavus TaxID=1886 RepID=UPI00343140B8